MLPAPEVFSLSMSALSIGDQMAIVIYEQEGVCSAPSSLVDAPHLRGPRGLHSRRRPPRPAEGRTCPDRAKPVRVDSSFQIARNQPNAKGKPLKTPKPELRKLSKLLATASRIALAHLPTPLESMPRLSAELGGPRLFVKRDDCTGLGVGGNKIRKLEFVMAAALAEGADCVVCGGVPQSNTSRQVAAACAKLGLDCHVGVMYGRESNVEPEYELSGNILLNRLFGATIHKIPWDEDRNTHLESLKAGLARVGRKPFLVPYGASDALGAMGYAAMVIELLGQCAALGISPNYVVHASGSAGTQAGITSGLAALDWPMRCIGIDIDAQAERVAADVRRIGRKAACRLGAENRWDDDLVEVVAGFAGPGYGNPDPPTLEAIRMAARLEGLVLDPVYSGKGMQGLIGLIRAGRFSADKTVVWLHTGGRPGLFVYPAAMNRT
jgi:L-cysteate sulfo-lyase